jgi:hypothetical protein
VKVNVYLRDRSKPCEFDAVYGEYVSDPWPARTLVQSSYIDFELEVGVSVLLRGLRRRPFPMCGARSLGALLIAVLVRRGLTYRIGKALQSRQRTAYALVFLATDSSVEKDSHSRCTGHVDDVHFDAPFCVFSLYKTVGCGRLFPNLPRLRGTPTRLLSNSRAIKTTALRYDAARLSLRRADAQHGGAADGSGRFDRKEPPLQLMWA